MIRRAVTLADFLLKAVVVDGRHDGIFHRGIGGGLHAASSNEPLLQNQVPQLLVVKTEPPVELKIVIVDSSTPFSRPVIKPAFVKAIEGFSMPDMKA